VPSARRHCLSVRRAAENRTLCGGPHLGGLIVIAPRTPVARASQWRRIVRAEPVAIAGRPLSARIKLLAYLYQGTAAILLFWGGLSIGRALLVAAGPVVMELLQRPLRRAVLRGAASDRTFIAVAISWQLFTGAMLALTGGMHSPMVAALAMAAVQPALLLGPHRINAPLAVSLAVIAAVVAALPASITGAVVTGWQHPAVAVLSFAWALFLFRQLVGVIVDSQSASTAAIHELREERLRELEAHTRSLQAVGARVAHELKNPLAVIKALVQLQSRRATGERERQQQDVMQSEIARMETLLREYLSFARPFEALQAIETDLGAIVEEAARVIAARAEHVGVELVVSTEPTPLVADAQRLKHALLNLMSNALDATPRCGRVTVTCLPTADGGARIEVADTGRGIPAEVLERIGTSFFTTRAEGTGLGVVQIVRVVAQHGGRVHYASAPGRGTRATVELPARACPLPPSIAALSTEALVAPVPVPEVSHAASSHRR
jgi:signal transduction histidine kinase